MAHILSDRVKETTTTTGTGTLALLGAVAQFRAFSAVMANNDTTLYAIAGQTGTEWEVGLGTWTTGNNLARTTPIAGSAATPVNFSAGTKNVFMTFTPTGRVPGMTFTGAITPATNDAAALGSGSGTLMWSDLFLATGAVISFNNGDVTVTHATNTLTFGGGSLTMVVNGDLDIGASGGTRAPINLAAGTLVGTPGDGDIEADATNFYGTTDAGNRGYIPVRHFIRANATRTYTSNVSAQTIFNSPANGRITLEAGTYRFGGVLSFGAMSATSGNRNINILGAGTAAVTNWMWIATGFDGATGTAGAAGSTHMITSTSPASVVTATIGTSLIVALEGTVEVNTAGTLIPTTTMVTAAASTMSIGSYFWIERLGTDALVSIGQWD